MIEDAKGIKDDIMIILDIASQVVEETNSFGYRGEREKRMSVIAIANAIIRYIRGE